MSQAPIKCNCASHDGQCPNPPYIVVLSADGKEHNICPKCILPSDKRLRLIPDVDIKWVHANTRGADLIDMICMISNARNFGSQA